jgi:ubiquinone/menaquinone biosynthesis C-methylase UbiE
VKKADYSKIATTYDSGRKMRDEVLDLWLDRITERARISDHSRILDLGCGTGRFSIPMARRFGCSVVGADKSPEMINKARQKDTGQTVSWGVQNADDLNYAENAFDIVFMSHLLHHVDSPKKVLESCYRILSPGGSIFSRYGAVEQILNDVEHRFFPETIAIDKARTPSVHDVETWLSKAGFKKISSEEIIQQSYESIQDRFQSIKLKNTSVLSLIPQSAFEKGIRQLEESLDKVADETAFISDKMTLTFGYRL